MSEPDTLDTAAIRANFQTNPYGHMSAVEVLALCDEVDRLRGLVAASWDVCARSGGCVPGRPW